MDAVAEKPAIHWLVDRLRLPPPPGFFSGSEIKSLDGASSLATTIGATSRALGGLPGSNAFQCKSAICSPAAFPAASAPVGNRTLCKEQSVRDAVIVSANAYCTVVVNIKTLRRNSTLPRSIHAMIQRVIEGQGNRMSK